jgi:transcriptional regulator with XRE-family HTH domain
MTIGQKIKQLRRAHRLTQEKLADILGVDRSLIYRWERDVNEPHLYSLMGMADLFGVSLDELCCYQKR